MKHGHVGVPGRLGRALFALVAAAALLTVASPQLHAQRWQSTFGSTCRESGRAGVQMLAAGGGFIAVGEQQSPFVACSGFGSRRDVYVVKTNDAGQQVWARSYSIGYNGSGGDATATCITECANGDFLICGYTARAGSTYPVPPLCHPTATTNDIFVLRISSTGGLVFSQIYGTDRAEAAFSIIELAPVGLNTRDIVVAGYGVQANGDQDALIMRLTPAGITVWSKYYPGGISTPDAFRGVIECRVGVPAGQNGDIVAVGITLPAPPALVIPDNYAVRVSSANGLIMPATNQGGLIWGNTMFPDELASVRELTVAPHAGQLVMVGMTAVTAAGGGPVVHEASVTRTTASLNSNQCNGGGTPILNQVSIGENGPLMDYAMDVREVAAGTGGLIAGRVIVAGYTTINSPANQVDYFLAELDPATLTLAPGGAGFKTYGAEGTEMAWSVNIIPGTVTRTAGFILCGLTTSASLMPAGHIEEMYLVRTGPTGDSYCNFLSPEPTIQTLNWPSQCYTPQPVNSVTSCGNDATWLDFEEWWPICYESFGIKGRERANDGISGVEPEGLIDMAEGSAIVPNPVTRGAGFIVKYDLRADADVRIKVTDMTGRVLFNEEHPLQGGLHRIPISTEGWAAGTYLVNLSSDGSTVSRTIVVTDGAGGN